MARLTKAKNTLATAIPLSRIALTFHADPADDKPLHENVSCIVSTDGGEHLWIAVDEGASLERLTAERDAEGRITGYGAHERFDLRELIDLPGDPLEEADVEGLSVSDGYLWVVGSHSLKRSKPDKAGDDQDKALALLTTVTREENRFLLGRLPLARLSDSGPELLHETADGRRAGTVAFRKKGSALSRLLRKDAHIGPFMSAPSKDNGLDVEGLAVDGERVFLGLRGPVLRGWAIVLELRVHANKKGELKLKKLPNGARYAKHFIDLDGLGVRSLMIDGRDFVILAGPTMDLDGPVRIYRWSGGLRALESSVVPRNRIKRLMELPFGEGADHAEGATMLALAHGEPQRLVVAYDSPAKERVLPTRRGAFADVFEAPWLR